jgi:hypothetical protein
MQTNGQLNILFSAPGSHWTGSWVGPRANPDTVENRYISCPCRESNHDFSVAHLQPSHYISWGIPISFIDNACRFIFWYHYHIMAHWCFTKFLLCQYEPAYVVFLYHFFHLTFLLLLKQGIFLYVLLSSGGILFNWILSDMRKDKLSLWIRVLIRWIDTERTVSFTKCVMCCSHFYITKI